MARAGKVVGVHRRIHAYVSVHQKMQKNQAVLQTASSGLHDSPEMVLHGQNEIGTSAETTALCLLSDPPVPSMPQIRSTFPKHMKDRSKP